MEIRYFVEGISTLGDLRFASREKTGKHGVHKDINNSHTELAAESTLIHCPNGVTYFRTKGAVLMIIQEHLLRILVPWNTKEK